MRFLIMFFKKHFYQKLYSDCCDKFDYPGSIVCLSWSSGFRAFLWGYSKRISISQGERMTKRYQSRERGSKQSVISHLSNFQVMLTLVNQTMCTYLHMGRHGNVRVIKNYQLISSSVLSLLGQQGGGGMSRHKITKRDIG